jgi:hypothetical protein
MLGYAYNMISHRNIDSILEHRYHMINMSKNEDRE